MDIEGLGESRVELFVNLGLLHDVADVYELTSSSLTDLEGFGEISAGNLLAAIDLSRHRQMTRLLVGLSIRHVGPTVAQSLAKNFVDLDAVIAATDQDLAGIDGVGPAIAKSLQAFFGAKENLVVVERLRKAGVELTSDRFVEGESAGQTLVGRSIVVTGTLLGFNRLEAEEAITSRGGKSPGTVSAKTFAVVIGESPGAAKVQKAEALNIPILDEEGFVRLLESGELS